MKVIECTTTPDGTEIQLEDWSDKNTEQFPDLYGLTIAAYPIAQRTGRNGWIRGGEKFRLSIGSNAYRGYTNENVAEDFEALKTGTKTLEDLAEHFNDGERHMWYLGMKVKNRGY